MKITIIGAGKVGSAVAFSLMHYALINELVLVDIIEKLVKGEAEDLNHAKVALNPQTKITGTASIEGIKDSSIIIITAGKARTADQLREDLLEINKKILKPVCEKIKDISPNAYIISVTNPSTEIGEFVLKTTGFPNERVIVMDNQLDTARLKYYISDETGLPINDIKSCVKGSHGKNMEFVFRDELTEKQKEAVKKKTIDAGKNIIELKGYTCWGIASQVKEIVNNTIAKIAMKKLYPSKEEE